MKLEKVVAKPKKGIWIFLFVLGLVVAGVMAASYNVEIVRRVKMEENIPWLKIIFGSLGFFGIIIALILFFIRLLKEMKISQIQADFLDRISHELRTPLSTLTLVSDLVKNETNSPEEVARLWRSHELELNRLKADVELLLQAARLRESKLRANMQAIDLEQWILDKWESFRVLLASNGDAYITRSGPALRGEVLVDTNLLELIVRNLLDNARKFSINQPVVEFRTEKLEPGWFRRKRWRLIVVDQGLGFSQKNEELLFKRFSRLPFQRSDLRSYSIPGTGLGLYLSATAARAMGLTLLGTSLGEGKGAEFTLEGEFL